MRAFVQIRWCCVVVYVLVAIIVFKHGVADLLSKITVITIWRFPSHNNLLCVRYITQLHFSYCRHVSCEGAVNERALQQSVGTCKTRLSNHYHPQTSLPNSNPFFLVKQEGVE